MIIANRLVFFLAILITFYVCDNYPSTIQKKQPLVIKRVSYVGLLISLTYILSGLLFETLLPYMQYGNERITTSITVTGFSLVLTYLSFFAPYHQKFLTKDIKKMMLVVQLLLALSTFTLIDPHYLIKEVVIYGGMYALFVIGFAGVKDRMSIAPIPDFIKGLPLDLLTLFLFLLSFSFLNGVFFDQLF
ncbi:hypothetical protein [Enterococcus saccharolyticus]|uniref:Uncharacterized protein n=1 Tax=Enterococcus saccharolyticus subsp. saccharolyticus ATCC 43076 TaxID=1139996 RepID=S0JM52_9ENTE|nr:hypothetical protein [Enterococcus saccharolyticus]EOT28963.1 hypothetical protein OMQ_01485 [Enterococcus saccharolyticus subsp. saccharolyticus ATCC 43076]EOT81329.1 hypothetical protein I572_01864 [Enterococcus saccharolyticus subsp. saccharolyticus ATCC 43076]OJG90334.1 hypothetical protein RV16_GL001735 [Enterococcus saccharolyticus]